LPIAGEASFPQASEWKAGSRPGIPAPGYSGRWRPQDATSLQSGNAGANWRMTSIARTAAAIAAILARDGIDYAQNKVVFRAARQRAGLQAWPIRK